LSFLLLSGDGQARAHEVALYAAQPAHWYRPGVTSFVPGDRPEYVARIDSYRCVFTYTVAEGSLWRHLSISLSSRAAGKLPSPIPAWTIASWFGFSGGIVAEGFPEGTAAPPECIIEPGADWIS
jgi:hypothetical protein